MTKRGEVCSLRRPFSNQNKRRGPQSVPLDNGGSNEMTGPAELAEEDSGTTARGASARERALRFNRGVIGLGLVALMLMLLLPI